MPIYDPTNSVTGVSQNIKDVLMESGLQPSAMSQLTPEQQQQLPYTTAGASNLQGIAALPYDPNTGAVTIRDRSKTGSNAGSSFIALNSEPNAYSDNQKMVMAHEMEHGLANQGLGSAMHGMNTKWDELVENNPMDSRNGVVRRLLEHAPYLQKEWGLPEDDVKKGYFSKKSIAAQGRLLPNLLPEQMATLSALEQGANKIFTDDPYVRKNILTTPAQRETYNALTGLRQSRLDAKDLPPYTRVPEPGMMDSLRTKVKDLTGYAAGGMVPQAGNNKLI